MLCLGFASKSRFLRSFIRDSSICIIKPILHTTSGYCDLDELPFLFIVKSISNHPGPIHFIFCFFHQGSGKPPLSSGLSFPHLPEFHNVSKDKNLQFTRSISFHYYQDSSSYFLFFCQAQEGKYHAFIWGGPQFHIHHLPNLCVLVISECG